MRLFCLLFFAFAQQAMAQDYQKAWDALKTNNCLEARKHLQKALENPATATDAMATLYFLDTYESRWQGFFQAFRAQKDKIANPYPYYFLFWDKDVVAGSYGAKNPEQLKFLKKVAEDPNAPGPMHTLANTYLSGHFFTRDESKKGLPYADAVGSINNWQIAGPFDNVVECGFDKNYPPITHPKPDAVFTSVYNADIRWETPPIQGASGWIFLSNTISWSNAIVYAQSFVTAPKDMDALVSLGAIGNFKVWVNDRLVLSDPEMRNSETAAFAAPCRLKKGTNRVLVQIGFLDQSLYGFRLQLCDSKGAPLTGLPSSSTYAAYPDDSKSPLPAPTPFFAEAFFREKLAADSDNMLNYFLLARCYGGFSDYPSALEVVNRALEKAPDCALLHFYRLAYCQMLENQTGADEESKTILTLDPESDYSLKIKFNEELENENIDEAEGIANHYQELYGESMITQGQKILIANKREKYQDAVAIIEQMYKDNPDSWDIAKVKYQIEANIKKDQKGAFEILETYIKDNYQNIAVSTLAQEYLSNGRADDAVKLYEKLCKLHPMNLGAPKQLFSYYFDKKENEKARFWLEKLLTVSPTSSTYLSSAAKLAEQEGNSTLALEMYQLALKHGPNNFDVRERIRELEKKPSLKKNFPETDPYALLKNVSLEGKKGKHPWFNLLYEQQVVLYPEQNSEMTVIQVVKVLDESGVDTWKEYVIDYDDNNQRLIIEKAEVVKPSGKKIAAERNSNQLVFTNLEPGDGLVVRYRLQTYSSNRISREYDASFGFDWFTPLDRARYSILAPKNVEIHYQLGNGAAKPEVKELPAEGYMLYTWDAENLAALDNEPLMPNTDDVRKIVKVGTMSDWSTISEWYGDITARQARSDYEVKKLVAEMFPAGETISENAKAKRIYEWILKNIRYSSVAFRQSGWVPQRASKVIQTRLGDCKDLATLYASIAREVGLKANLVLLSSRESGMFGLSLPTMGFDHCLVKVVADKQVWYLELTDSSLPFGSLPNADFQSQALDIPFGKGDQGEAKLFVLDPANRTPDILSSQVEIAIGKKDLTLSVQATASGALTGWMRDAFKTIPPEKRLEQFQENIAKEFSNPVSVKNVSFGDLEKLNDTLQHHVNFVVRNEVEEIGDMSTFKIPFYTTYVHTGAFPEDEARKFPLSYRNYETADSYHDEITLRIPEGKTFNVVPADAELKYGKNTYSLKFVRKSANTLLVTRDIHCQRADIAAAEYDKFREFVLAVTEVEGKILTFK